MASSGIGAIYCLFSRAGLARIGPHVLYDDRLYFLAHYFEGARTHATQVISLPSRDPSPFGRDGTHGRGRAAGGAHCGRGRDRWQPQLPTARDAKLILDGPTAPAAPPANSAAILFDNGPLTTNPGGGAGGANASAVQTALGLTTYGFGHAITSGFRMADDFTVPAGGWNISTITFYAYQTGSTTTTTINNVNLRIWNGVPGAAQRRLRRHHHQPPGRQQLLQQLPGARHRPAGQHPADHGQRGDGQHHPAGRHLLARLADRRHAGLRPVGAAREHPWSDCQDRRERPTVQSDDRSVGGRAGHAPSSRTCPSSSKAPPPGPVDLAGQDRRHHPRRLRRHERHHRARRHHGLLLLHRDQHRHRGVRPAHPDRRRPGYDLHRPCPTPWPQARA